jgi:peptide-methionine (R)-S-oxide reductase
MLLARRRFLQMSALAGSAGLWGLGAETALAADAFADSPFRRVSDAEWRQRLSPAAYAVLRHEATERPFSSPLDHETRKGLYVCAGCELPLFRSDWKYDSGTGWPSFWTVMGQNVGSKADFALAIEERTEYHCARCLGHQGHVFKDGPRPTGLRYCNNGVALKFVG